MGLIGDQFSEKDAAILAAGLKNAAETIGFQIRQLGPDAVKEFLDRVDGITITLKFDKRA